MPKQAFSDKYALIARGKMYISNSAHRNLLDDDTIEFLEATTMHTFQNTGNNYALYPISPGKKLQLSIFDTKHKPESHITFLSQSSHHTYKNSTKKGEYKIHSYFDEDEEINQNNIELQFTDIDKDIETYKIELNQEDALLVAQYAQEESKSILEKLQRLNQYFITEYERLTKQHKEVSDKFHDAHLHNAAISELNEHLKELIEINELLSIISDKPKRYLTRIKNSTMIMEKLSSFESSCGHEESSNLDEKAITKEDQTQKDTAMKDLAIECTNTIKNMENDLAELYSASPKFSEPKKSKKLTKNKNSTKEKEVTKTKKSIINREYLGWVARIEEAYQELQDQIADFPPSKNSQTIKEIEDIQTQCETAHITFMQNTLKEIFSEGENDELTANALRNYKHWIPYLSKEDANTIFSDLIAPEKDKGKLLTILIANYGSIDTPSLFTAGPAFFSSTSTTAAPVRQPCLVERIIEQKAYSCLLEMRKNKQANLFKNGTDGLPLAYHFFKDEAIDEFTIKCIFRIFYPHLNGEGLLELLRPMESLPHISRSISFISKLTSTQQYRFKKIMRIPKSDLPLHLDIAPSFIREPDIQEQTSSFQRLRIRCYYEQIKAKFSDKFDTTLFERYKNLLSLDEMTRGTNRFERMRIDVDIKLNPQSTEAQLTALNFCVHEALFNYLHIIMIAIDKYQRGLISRSELESERDKSDFYRRQFIKWEACAERVIIPPEVREMIQETSAECGKNALNYIKALEKMGQFPAIGHPDYECAVRAKQWLEDEERRTNAKTNKKLLTNGAQDLLSIDDNVVQTIFDREANILSEDMINQLTQERENQNHSIVRP